MENSRFLKTVIACLLFLNLGMLWFLLAKRPGNGRPPEPKDIIIQKLELDGAQQDKFKDLRDEHQAAMRACREKNAAFRKELYVEIAAGKPDSLKIDRLADSILIFQKRAELATFDHFKKLRATCRPEQQAKFDLFIGEIVQGMMQPMGPPRRK